ncbi:hypothetical protein BDN70DRAFT_990458 [Pholiota conissans]|uniref:Uncharacterized protein n=1 Tax=Pholiota conissans TaxID=109636 RepID=A0A9P5ZC76_9AGAR|nr:hypothetical protein BDN70DRAFT_990458 [Pholiota conissans]
MQNLVHSKACTEHQVQQGHTWAEIDEYFHIPCVLQLFKAHYGLSRTVARLLEEKQELREGNERLQRQLEQFQTSPSANYTVTRYRTVSESLAPSNSISQSPSRRPSGNVESGDIKEGSLPALRIPKSQPTTRPAEYPVEILWLKDDCKTDTLGAQPQTNNSSRPRMRCAIREKDGSVIDKQYYSAIQKVAVMRVEHLVQEEERLGGPLPKDKLTKRYFWTERIKQWENAIAVLEEEYPVLALAAANWKAEQLLVNGLASLRTRRNTGPSKKMKRSTKNEGLQVVDDRAESSSDGDCEGPQDAGDADGGKEKVSVGLKRKWRFIENSVSGASARTS